MFQGSIAAYQAVTWPHITDIKSGDHKLLISPLNTTFYNHTQYYGTGLTFSPAPRIILSVRDLKIDQTTSMNFKVYI